MKMPVTQCRRCKRSYRPAAPGNGWGGTDFCSRLCKRRAHHARRSKLKRLEHRTKCPTPAALIFFNEKGATRFAVKHGETAYKCTVNDLVWHATEPHREDRP